ncbi:ABC transporter permease [Microvirga puerhi]|uniref:Iron ABC transporter permease n=1 Tax=Microvirga puerhi TaxID=2876078 RepID=A0ABS7VK29_9HYPH|nr:iron ABC transporter permease [Microvirga puerhi]MBZ6075891.1 iron ABC transporter permease [Microvirga puerhi]
MARATEAIIFRGTVVAALAAAVLAPVGLIIYQSFLSGPFFDPTATVGWDAFGFIFTDPDFYSAFGVTVIFAIGVVAIAVPLGAALAFLLTRTDLIGRKILEPLALVPMFLSAIVLGFGYTVSLGPSGLVSLGAERIFGFVPWNIYGLGGLILFGGLTHVPHVYLYASAAMRNIASDMEEAARTTGAGIWQVAWHVTWPLTFPALIFASMLNVLLAFESFGLPLILGDPAGTVVLTTYIYKLTALLGVPSYQLMAAVAVVLLALTFPLVFIQRRLLAQSRRYVTVGGKGARATRIHLGPTMQCVALAGVALWLLLAVVFPIGGIVVRAFVSAWGRGINIFEHLTLDNFRQLLIVPALARSLTNTVILAVVGGAIAVGAYLLVALAGHRWRGRFSSAIDYLVLLPKALPGLVVGLSFFWVFLFVPALQPLRPTLISLLIAYTIVGLSYGFRMIQANLLQVSPDLEEAARTAGATTGQTWRSVVVPIIRPGLIGAWTMMIIVFLREYATGVYLMTNGTEVLGSMIVSMIAGGSVDMIAALSFISIVFTLGGFVLALRLGVRVNE